MLADQAIEKLINDYEFNSVIDIGSGNGSHAKLLRKNGKTVTTISLIAPADIVADFNQAKLEKTDCIWCSHALEHQRNVGLFLDKCYELLNDGGILAITVPPLKHEIVGGQVSLWNAGLLLYNLILAGFDCSEAAVKKYGYNISVIVKKKPAQLPKLVMDQGDVDSISRFFPIAKACEQFNGQIVDCNWGD